MSINNSSKSIFYKTTFLVITIVAFFTIYNKISYSDQNHRQENVDFSLLMKKTQSEKITGHKIQIEIQNGCGQKGIAKLYTNFLRNNGYDVVNYKNAKNFNYNRTQIIIHKQDTSKFIDEIVNILKISPQLAIYNYNDYSIHEMTVIIGSDYNNLDSFEEVSMHYEPF